MGAAQMFHQQKQHIGSYKLLVEVCLFPAMKYWVCV